MLKLNSSITIMIVLMLAACGGKSAYINDIEKEQKRRNAVFINPQQSPLDSTEITQFKGLVFYAPNETYKTTAEITWLPQINYLNLPMSNGSTDEYMHTAIISFELNGIACNLNAYQTNEMKRQHSLFVPFTDLTNTTETYAGGRYLDIAYVDNKKEVTLDFNFAYIPFCAHTPRYACPKVPKENALPIKVEAGERL
jgi:uncharacterized protein